MFDIEFMILERQETESDDCKNCEHKSHCNNECEQITVYPELSEIYPGLFINSSGKGKRQ